jgi:hypothetical protein
VDHRCGLITGLNEFQNGRRKLAVFVWRIVSTGALFPIQFSNSHFVSATRHRSREPREVSF